MPRSRSPVHRCVDPDASGIGGTARCFTFSMDVRLSQFMTRVPEEQLYEPRSRESAPPVCSVGCAGTVDAIGRLQRFGRQKLNG